MLTFCRWQSKFRVPTFCKFGPFSKLNLTFVAVYRSQVFRAILFKVRAEAFGNNAVLSIDHTGRQDANKRDQTESGHKNGVTIELTI